jgi:hypothetical protein
MTLTRAELQKALEHLQAGNWQAAHEIVQRDEASALACWAFPSGADAAAETRALGKEI